MTLNIKAQKLYDEADELDSHGGLLENIARKLHARANDLRVEADMLLENDK
jgi:hypothetical protein